MSRLHWLSAHLLTVSSLFLGPLPPHVSRHSRAIDRAYPGPTSRTMVSVISIPSTVDQQHNSESQVSLACGFLGFSGLSFLLPRLALPSSRPAVVSFRSHLSCLVSRLDSLSPFRSGGLPSSTSSMRQTLATLFKRTGNTSLLSHSE